MSPSEPEVHGLSGHSHAREAWWDRAACRGCDPELFFPERGESIAQARRVCAGCPVQLECRAYAFAAGERFGIWGGVSEYERRRARNAINAARARPTNEEEPPMTTDELIRMLRTAGYAIDLAPGEHGIVLIWSGLDEPAPALAAMAREEACAIHDAIVAERAAQDAAYALATDVDDPPPGWEPVWPIDELGM